MKLYFVVDVYLPSFGAFTGPRNISFFLKKEKKSTQGFARNMGLMIYEGEVNIYTICIEYVPKKPI